MVVCDPGEGLWAECCGLWVKQLVLVLSLGVCGQMTSIIPSPQCVQCFHFENLFENHSNSQKCNAKGRSLETGWFRTMTPSVVTHGWVGGGERSTALS